MRIVASHSPWIQRLVVLSALLAVSLSAACGTDPAPAKKDTATEEDTDPGNQEDGVTVDSTADGAQPQGDGTGDSGTSADTQVADGASDDQTAVDGDATVVDDAVDAGGDASATGDVTSGTDAGKPPGLPLPDCAIGSCSKCGFCAVTPICVDGVTYSNDCEAICKLNLKEGLAPIIDKVKKGACPACAACGTETIKCNVQTKFCTKCENGTCTDSKTAACKSNLDCVDAFTVCAVLEDGTQVSVANPCEATCLKLKTGITNPKPGPCKTKCSAAPSSCPLHSSSPAVPELPVCAKQDGKTYDSDCALKNCALDGCYAVGSTAATTECAAGLTKECDGQCFAEASKVSAQAKNCPTDCNAVCGILPTGKGMSFRNECLAKNAGAVVKDCAGVSATASDACSSTLYTNKGCCPGVDYTQTGIKQVCAKKVDPNGGKDQWVTFRNSKEFTCLSAGDKSWEYQYDGACLCACNNIKNEVCGDDNVTYLNQCVAECYNKDLPGFNTKTGACKP